VTTAAEPVIQQALADGHAAGFVDSLIDSAVAHQASAAGIDQPQAGDAGAPHSVDLAALLALQVGPDSAASAVPQPVFNFDHAGAELLAAAHA
jgi:hypothetical protein